MNHFIQPLPLKLAKSSLIILACSVFVAACSSTPEKEGFSENFVTQISEDGSKRFQYTLQKGIPDGGRKRGGRVKGGGMKGGGMMGAGGARRGQGDDKNRTDMIAKMQEKVKAQAQGSLEEKLAEVEFCREGYMVLHEAFTMGRSQLLGECRDTASEEDRQRFPNSSSEPITNGPYSMPKSLP
ncbi:hypothetical protein [uncultured Pseudoteredinibacter sp.]|uniref:hypothetical protein n=1 Tax=uncultured Pseudoteredinibacter sp. TaxID=1641701 RepID=UPI00262325B4|nr:hypothetical protein [uncultured Pseudoteredinibacter sp.]